MCLNVWVGWCSLYAAFVCFRDLGCLCCVVGECFMGVVCAYQVCFMGGHHHCVCGGSVGTA